MSSTNGTHKQTGVMFRIEVALLLSIVGAGVWMGLPGCSSTVSDVRKPLQERPVTGQFGTPAAFEHLVQRTRQMDARPLQSSTGPRVSDNFPDVVLTNHRDQKLRFRSDLVRDRIACFAMFYTRCTGSCPGTISKMLKIRESLTSQFGRDNIQFVCITLDPEHDSPETLRQYAESVDALGQPELADIHFCTGAPEDLELVRRALGMYDLDPEVDADRSQHAAMIVIGNDRYNRWASAPSGLPVEEIHETCLRIAGTTERQRFGLRLALDSGFKDDALADIEDAPMGFSTAAAAASEGSCCSKKDSADACCKDKAVEGACCSEKMVP